LPSSIPTFSKVAESVRCKWPPSKQNLAATAAAAAAGHRRYTYYRFITWYASLNCGQSQANRPFKVQSISLIPRRLHDQAGSTNWLDALVVRSSEYKRQGRFQDFKLGGVKQGGLGDGSSPVGSRSKNPGRGSGNEVFQKLKVFANKSMIFLQWCS